MLITLTNLPSREVIQRFTVPITAAPVPPRKTRKTLQERLVAHKEAAQRKRADYYARGLDSSGKPRKAKGWSGLSNKRLGHTEYTRQYRALKKSKP